MFKENISKLLTDSTDLLCYVLQSNSCDLLFANKVFEKVLGIDSVDVYEGRSAKEFFLDCNSTFENFYNPELSTLEEGETLAWQGVEKNSNTDYSFYASTSVFDNQKAILVFGYKIEAKDSYIEALEKKLSLEETLVKCVKALMQFDEIGDGMSKLFSIVNEYYDGDRTYLFEIKRSEGLAHNTYEWSADPKYKKMQLIPHVPLDAVDYFIANLNENNEFIVSDIYTEIPQEIPLLEELKKVGILSMIVVPFFENGEVSSFMGVDNPKNKDNDLNLLQDVMVFVGNEIRKRRLIEELDYLSYYDKKTGLYNRNKYLNYVQEVREMRPTSIGVINVDINGLKMANDLYGNDHGDVILETMANVLAMFVREDLFYIGGGEYVSVFLNTPQEEFEAVVASLRNFSHNMTDFSYSVGSAWIDKNLSVERCFTQANEVLYAEKQNYYKTISPDKMLTRKNAAEMLLAEIHEGYFSAYLQPKVNIRTGQIIGAEALIRKHDEHGKPVPPDKFIPAYEHDGTVGHVDFHILELVCLFLQQLIEDGIPIKIAVNFSRVTFLGHDMLENLIAICEKYNVPRDYVKIEITESIDKMDFDFFNSKIKTLTDAGFSISLDDFGAKQSNLHMLTLPYFSEVKVDKCLVDEMHPGTQGAVLIKNIIRMIKELGPTMCVTEGIETAEQRDMLVEYGCEIGQGYFFYRPMSIEEFLVVYKDNLEKYKDQ